MVASTALSEMMGQTRRMQEKITDLEGRSRRNNIRIFGLPEDTEGSSAAIYLEQLLKAELERCAQVNYCQLSTVRDEGNDFEESLAEKATSRRQTNLL